MQAYVEFLKGVLDTINFLCEKERYEAAGEVEQYTQLFAQKEQMVKSGYEWIKSNGLDDGLREFLKKEYGDDREVYLVLLDYIYSIVKDIKFEVDYMQQRLEQGIVNNEDVFTLINLDMQIRSASWRNGMNISFEKQWNMNKVLGERLKKTIGFSCEKIPVADRDENMIVIFASQVLGDKHAPSRRVFDTCYRLKKILKKEVLVVNFAQYTNIQKLQNAGVVTVDTFTICEAYNGKNECEYQGVEFPMWQVALDEDNVDEIRSVLEFVYSLKPYCIWNIATLPAVMGLINQITTSVYADCTVGYAPVITDIFYNYFANASDTSRQNRKFLVDSGTEVVDVVTIGERDEVCTDLTREDLGIPQEAFLLCVAGNRLTFDCDESYFHMIDAVIDNNPQVHLMVIGIITDEFIEKNTANLRNRMNIHFLGYREDFIECMSLMDLYVNSFGVGGGTAGNNALFLGKPIITLTHGDVYSFVGEEFGVNSIDDYIPLIERYMNDNEFYQMKSQLARKRYESLVAGDEKMVEAIEKILKKVR